MISKDRNQEKKRKLDDVAASSRVMPLVDIASMERRRKIKTKEKKKQYNKELGRVRKREKGELSKKQIYGVQDDTEKKKTS